MDSPDSIAAQQIAQAARAFEQQRTGHAPLSVSVVLNEDTLVITLRGALSPAEKALAGNPKSAAQLQELHRQLFAVASGPLRREIERIVGVKVCEATAEIETIAGTIVQVFLLAGRAGTQTWSDGPTDV